MIFSLFRRRRPNADIVERLFERISSAARNPAFYRHLGVPDTVEGRFDMMVIHAHLVLRRLNALPDPARELAQEVVDAIFQSFDTALRELGVGDISVPKRMKTMASAFFGRAKAYEDALADPAALAAAVDLNVYGRAAPSADEVGTIVTYMQEAVARFEALGFDDFVAGRISFPSLPENRP